MIFQFWSKLIKGELFYNEFQTRNLGVIYAPGLEEGKESISQIEYAWTDGGLGLRNKGILG